MATPRHIDCYLTARALTARGWSVIPLQPGSKVAAVAWSEYQRRVAIEQELIEWLQTGNFAGLAIVTGQISKLVVLDFDTPDLYEKFITENPHLDTYTTRTKRGYHLYYQTARTVPSKQGRGVDLSGEGRYVVAPPSAVDGHTYELITPDVRPRKLKPKHLAQIERFVETARTVEKPVEVQPTIPPVPHKLPDEPQRRKLFEPFILNTPYWQPEKRKDTIESRAVAAAGVTTEYQLSPLVMTPESARRFFRSHLQSGRNNALFVAALRCRDDGQTVKWTQDALIGLHVDLLRDGETKGARRREAIATIKSAYSRPARPGLVSIQLPNTAREKLLLQELDPVARGLDGLRVAGIAPGDTFTYFDAKRVLRGLVGDWSIRPTLDWLKANFRLSPDPTPDAYGVALKRHKTSKTNCICLDGQSQQKLPETRKPGRPPEWYCMPSNGEICRVLGVSSGYSTHLSRDEISGVKLYRMALNTDFIRRFPGVHHLDFLAARLGVHKRTIQRYIEDSSVNSIPQYVDYYLTWQNLGLIPDDIEHAPGGCFLQRGDGERAPPVRQLAMKWLAQKHSVRLRYQDGNYYYVGQCPRADVKLGIHAKQDVIDESRERTRQWHKEQKAQKSTQLGRRIDSAPKTSAELRDKTATMVYDALQQDGKRLISLKAAKGLVKQYGPGLVGQGLNVLEHRASIRNPAAFLHVWLRSTARFT